MVKGFEGMHSCSILDKVGRSDKIGHGHSKVNMLKDKFGEENVYQVERSRKHRYFMFLGTKREVRKMKSALRYNILPYPKGDNIRYDASYNPNVQLTLF